MSKWLFWEMSWHFHLPRTISSQHSNANHHRTNHSIITHMSYFHASYRLFYRESNADSGRAPDIDTAEPESLHSYTHRRAPKATNIQISEHVLLLLQIHNSGIYIEQI